MGKKLGDYNKCKLAGDPKYVEFRLDKHRCSEDLFTMDYCTRVHDTIVLPDENEIRFWVRRNIGSMTRTHLASFIRVPGSYVCRWLTRSEFSMGYTKILKIIDYLDYVYSGNISPIYVPEPSYVGGFLKDMVHDGFVFADPLHIEWRFRVSNCRTCNFYTPDSNDNVSYAQVKKWQDYVWDAYYQAFSMVRDGHEKLIFGEDR